MKPYVRFFEDDDEEEEGDYTEGTSLDSEYAQKALNGYLEAILFSEMDEDDEPLDRWYGINSFSDGSISKAREDINRFLFQAAELTPGFMEVIRPEYIGHNLLLTRNHHGFGFWAEDNNKEINGILDKIAKRFRETYITVYNDIVEIN